MNRHVVLTLVFGLLLAPFASAETATWSPDKDHSSVNFTATHMSISKVRGHIRLADGKVEWNDADITQSKVNIVIDVATIDTAVEKRDQDLKSENFFDVAKYPTATFVSTRITKSGQGLTIVGDLTLHGVTKPVTLQVEGPLGPATGMDKKQHMGFSATTTLDRTAFGITKYPDAFISNQIPLTIDLDLAKQ
jgi:polyisoprenoid-binding protein YceI